MKLLKTIFLALVLAHWLAPSAVAQKDSIPKGKRKCGTVLTEKQKAAEIERAASGFYREMLAPQANRPFWIPLTIHIVRRSNGTGGFTTDNLKIAMQNLNELWLQAGMQFYQYGNIDYINSDYHYTLPDVRSRWDELRQVNPVALTINVYFVSELTNWCGQATFTTDAIQGIIMDNDCAGADEPGILAHEIGHYFDLYHTHETAFGVECPSGSNCSTAGDRICDTPADPDLTDRVNEFCAYTGGANTPPGCGTLAYNPPTRNIMSYSRQECRTQLTANQNSKALNILLFNNTRNNLYQNISRYVAPDGDLNSGCGYTVPCRTLERAVFVADHGDHIFMLGGTTYFFTPINKRVFIRKWNTDAGNVFVIP